MQATATQQQPLSAKLGPGALATQTGSPFTISADQWSSLNGFVSGVNATTQDSAARIAGLVPAYSNLRSAAAVWPVSTLPKLLSLAAGVADYGINVVPPAYSSLEQTLQKWEANPPNATELDAFLALLAPLQNTASVNAAAAGDLVPDLQRLMDAIESCNHEIGDAMANAMSGAAISGGHGDQTALLIAAIQQAAGTLSQAAAVLSVVSTPPVAEIERVRGAWGCDRRRPESRQCVDSVAGQCERADSVRTRD